MGKQLTIGGHNVRKGHYLMRIDERPDNDGEPVCYYPHRRARWLWRLVDRFNRINKHKLAV